MCLSHKLPNASTIAQFGKLQITLTNPHRTPAHLLSFKRYKISGYEKE